MKRSRRTPLPETDIDNSVLVSHLSIDTYAIGRLRFSVMSPEELNESRYTLVCLSLDASASSHCRRQAMEHLVKGTVTLCKQHADARNVLLRVATFGTYPNEIQGFTSLPQCNPANYQNAVSCMGMTALYDAALDAVQATAAFGRYLHDRQCVSKGVVILVTDGCDNHSTFWPQQVRDALPVAVERGYLESITSILVGVLEKDSGAYQEMSDSLRRFASQSGFTHYVEWDVLNFAELISVSHFICDKVFSLHRSLESVNSNGESASHDDPSRTPAEKN